MQPLQLPAPIQELNDPLFERYGVRVWMKREDLIHPIISGNKWRKLALNLEAMQQAHHSTLLTFGGAFSNHIVASAASAKKFGVKSIGVIRGEASAVTNPTLTQAKQLGMELHFVSRSDYRLKETPEFLAHLKEQFGAFYHVPEGGANALGAKGCGAILQEINFDFDVICLPMGTGTTFAGIFAALTPKQTALGFSVLKGGQFLKDSVNQMLQQIAHEHPVHLEDLVLDYHFGGYAKMKPELLAFMRTFYQQHGIKLDPVYTAKMCFGFYQELQAGRFKPESKIVLLHTGGLQGIQGMEERLGQPIYP